jgi:hypothetical protein
MASVAQMEGEMTIETKLAELQVAMNRYGEASIQNYRTIHPIGEKIIDGFAAYLGEGSATLGVPPNGDWRHDGGGYADAKFSTYWNGVLKVDTISMGLAISIPHTKDDGAIWIRVVLDFLIEGGTLTINVGDGAVIKDISLQCELDDLEPVYEAIFSYVKGIFADPVNYAEAQRTGKIGFLVN